MILALLDWCSSSPADASRRRGGRTGETVTDQFQGAQLAKVQARVTLLGKGLRLAAGGLPMLIGQAISQVEEEEWPKKSIMIAAASSAPRQ
jgi:hypothetical protein